MVVETSDKNQCSYFYVLNPFLNLRSGEHIAHLLNATHLLVIKILIRFNLGEWPIVSSFENHVFQTMRSKEIIEVIKLTLIYQMSSHQRSNVMNITFDSQLLYPVARLFQFVARFTRVRILNSKPGGSREVLISVSESGFPFNQFF